MSHSRFSLSLSLTAGGVTLFTPKQGTPLVINHTVSTASKQNMPHHTTPPPCISTTVLLLHQGMGIYRPKAYTRQPVSESNKSNAIDWKNRRDSGIAKTISSGGTLGRVLENNLARALPRLGRRLLFTGVDTEIMTHFKGIGQQPARQLTTDIGAPAPNQDQAKPNHSTRPRKQSTHQ